MNPARYAWIVLKSLEREWRRWARDGRYTLAEDCQRRAERFRTYLGISEGF